MASVLDINRVRLLIADTGTDRVLDDMQLYTYLELNGQNVRLAAVSKVIRTQDLATDGAKVAAELRALAQRLRDRVALDDGYDGFDLVGGVSDCPTGERPELTRYVTGM